MMEKKTFRDRRIFTLFYSYESEAAAYCIVYERVRFYTVFVASDANKENQYPDPSHVFWPVRFPVGKFTRGFMRLMGHDQFEYE